MTEAFESRIPLAGRWGQTAASYHDPEVPVSFGSETPAYMSTEEIEHLRVLIANERRERLELIVAIVEGLGHVVVERHLEVEQVATATAEVHPDLALVGLGESSQHALQLISRIVQEAACPVIAILEGKDANFVREAAKRGLFGYIVDGDPAELQAEIDVVLRRFSEFQNLEGAFGRRAITERAKGILMARNLIGEREAFELLRGHARQKGRKLVDVAAAVVDVHDLLAGSTPGQPWDGDSRPAREASRGAADRE